METSMRDTEKETRMLQVVGTACAKVQIQSVGRQITFPLRKKKSLESRQGEPRGLRQAGEMAHSQLRQPQEPREAWKGFQAGD